MNHQIKLFKTNPRDYLLTILVWAIITVISFFLVPLIGYRAIGYLYLFSVIAIGFRSTLGPIILSTLISALAWNFFFITPYFTLHISDIEDRMMFSAFLFVGLLSGVLARQLRQREMFVIKREKNTRVLFHLLKNFSKSISINQVAELTNKSLLDLFNFKSTIFLNKNEELSIISTNIEESSNQDLILAKFSHKNNKKAGWSTQVFPESMCLSIPLGNFGQSIGAILLYPQNLNLQMSISDEVLLENIILLFTSTIEHILNITKKQDYELLKNSEKLHQTLLNSISHEMRTPITTIMGNISALENPLIFADHHKNQLLNKDIKESCMRLNQVVENLLDMNRLESGFLTLSKEWIEFDELVNNVISHFNLPANLFRIKKLSESPFLFCDVKLMEHALFNLFSNAIKYSPASTNIEVEATLNSSMISIFVKDFGPGIPLEEQELIFQKFYRVKGRVTSGIGLGLSIVKNIIDLHDGRVYVTNRVEAPGTIFEIQLPVNQSKMTSFEAQS